MKLRLKLLLPILSFLALSFVAIHYFWLPGYIAGEKDYWFEKEYEYVRMLSIALSADLLVGDLGKIHETLNLIVALKPEWRMIHLFNETGVRLYPLQAQSFSPAETDRNIVWFIYNESRPIGSIEVILDLQTIMEPKILRIHILEGFFYSILLLLTLVSFVSLDVWVSRPLSAMARAVQSISRGDYHSPLTKPANDEIGQLNHAVDRMRGNLETRERELIRSERRLAAIISNSVDGIITIDQQGRINDFNGAAEKIFGYDENEVRGRNVRLLIPEPHRSNHDRYLKNYLTSGERKIIGRGREVNAMRKEGTIFPIWLSLGEVPDAEERLFVASVSDMTERKKAEDELRLAKEAAATANRAKSEFLANMSHEIRTPLNSVIGFSHLLNSLVEDRTQKQYLNAIVTSGQSLLRLINDILDLSKIEAGRLELQVEPVNIAGVLAEIRQIFSVRVMEKELAFQIEIEETIPPSLWLDETRIRQVLLNLVGNAVKFTDKGHVKLTAHHTPSTRDVSKIDLVLAVADTGIGIPPNQIETIFESFRQQDGQSNRRYGGTGLGLAISRRLVEMMNGSIEVTSVWGEGSAFTVILKNISLAASIEDSKEASIALDWQLMRFDPTPVLVVDDAESNRYLLLESLARVGLIGSAAENGQQAVASAQKDPPAVVIMDIRMPVMDGFEALKRIQANPRTAMIPVIALTADVTVETIAKIEKAGFAGHLLKPIDLSRLFLELAKYIDHTDRALDNRLDETLEKVETEIVTDLPGLVRTLETGVLKHWEELQGAVDMTAVEIFAQNLSEVAQRHGAKRLGAYATQLQEATVSFEIREIKRLLPRFVDWLATYQALGAAENRHPGESRDPDA